MGERVICVRLRIFAGRELLYIGWSLNWLESFAFSFKILMEGGLETCKELGSLLDTFKVLEKDLYSNRLS